MKLVDGVPPSWAGDSRQTKASKNEEGEREAAGRTPRWGAAHGTSAFPLVSPILLVHTHPHAGAIAQFLNLFVDIDFGSAAQKCD